MSAIRALGALLALPLAVLLPPAARAQGAAPATPPPAAGDAAREEARAREVAIGAARVLVLIADARSSVRVQTPVGVFRVTADSATLAAWATAGAALGAPAVGAGGAPAFSGIVLRHPQRPDVMRLTRLTADSLPLYQLDVSNGAWDHALRVDPPEAAALFAALRGERDPAARPAESRAAAAPPRALYEFEVQTPVRGGRGVRSPRYPRELDGTGIGGEVVMQYVVTPEGTVDPSSLHVIASVAPAFTLAVREAVLASRYEPARLGGRPVAQLIQQPFVFQPR